MELPKGERSILAYFPSSTKASAAAKEIVNAGLVQDSDSIQVDRVSRYSLNNNKDINGPINNARTLSGPTLYSASSGSQGPDPLLASSDSASGMADGGAGMAGGSPFLLTVITKEENVSQAVQIIKNHGGRV
ncbi:hypothetical protein [Syntrophomonas palmitatica]|uniref:hypothetical protein n=1 Tax=Syntrophomonas palmitatica TaxID=402877 RepID=UPI0006D26992|nr:hypothetical protein [Syntrophomonas palmitatica]